MCVGVVFTILELRNLAKARQTDLIIRLYSTMGSREFQEIWEKFSARESKDFNAYVKEYSLSEVNELGIFFEGIGVLLHRKLVDISLVEELFATPIKVVRERMKTMTEAYRKQLGRPQIFEWFENAYNEMQRREQRLQQIKQ